MADERINLTFAGDYQLGDAFKNLNNDVTRFQKATKDMSQAARSSLSSLAGAFDTELGGAIGKTAGLVNEMARGGIWGVMAAAANQAIGFIAEKLREAQEAAAKFADICRNEVMSAISAAADNFKSVSSAISDARADAKDMLDILNGEIAGNAEMKVHELHIETLQKITDNMSNTAKNVILADEAYQAAVIKGTAAIEQAEAVTTAAKEAVKSAADRRTAAEEALAKISDERAKLEAQMFDFGRGWLAKRNELAANIEKNEQMYNEGLISQSAYLKNRKDLSVQLAKLEEEHKDDLTKLNAAKKAEEDATKELEKAKRDETKAARDVEKAAKKEEVARTAAATAEGEAKIKLDAANRAVAREAEAAQKAQKAADDKAYQDAINADITRICSKNQVKAAEYIELFATCIANGATEAEAYQELQKRLNDELKNRADAEAGATASAKSGKKRDKDGNVITSVSIDPKEVGEGVHEWDGKTTWSKMRDKLSDDVKNEHQEQKKQRAEMSPFISLLKGNMPKTFTDEYKKMLTAEYSKDQLKDMYKKAMESQLLSKSEQKQQMKTFQSILKCMEDQGLK